MLAFNCLFVVLGVKKRCLNICPRLMQFANPAFSENVQSD